MRRLRRFFDGEIYFVTIRTVEQRFALEPHACPNAWQRIDDGPLDLETRLAMTKRGQECVKTTAKLAKDIAEYEQDPDKPLPEVSISTYTDSIPNIIGSVMARGLHLYKTVKLYGFVWMSNHGHLLLQASKEEFSAFMCYLNGKTAYNINRYLGRQDQLWSRRYAAAQVLDEGEELNKLAYILANPQNAGLASAIEYWPGLSSAAFFFGNQEQHFLHFDRTAWHNKNCPDNLAPFLSTAKLEHAVLPQLQHLTKKERRRLVRKLINENGKSSSSTANSEQSNLTRSPRTALALFAVIPTDRPESAKRNPRKRSPQPLCHTTNPVLRALYKESHREFRLAYKTASMEYRQGNTNVEFPPGSFPPSRYPPARHPRDPDARPILHPNRRNLELAAAQLALAK